MADLQIVFADNPRWSPSKEGAKVVGKKDLQSQGKSNKVNKKEKSRMKKKPSPAQLRARKKFAAMARARSKAAKAKNRKKKNPYKFVASKGKKTIKTNSFGSKKEMKGIAHRLSKFKAAQGRGYLRKRSKRGRAVAKAVKQIESRVKANTRYRKAALKKARALKKKGYKVKKVYVSPKSTLASAYKSVSKRKKRKGAKHSRKESKVAKRRRKKKAGAKRKVHRRKKGHAKRRSRRKGGRRVVYLSKKRKSVVIRRKNPSFAQVESYTGFKAEELGSLLIGGAVYGTVDGLAAQYAPAVYQMAAKIPVLGTTVVPAAIGVALKIAGDKFKIKPLAMVGEGIVGAAVVAMGIQASAYLPGISKPVAGYAGVDFTPSMRGYARDGADFGNVDFTPGMGSAPQLGLEAQMGRDPGSADFGLIPEGLGLVPEGLGGLA